MHTIQFWKSWTPFYQRIGLLVAATFVFAIGYMWISYFQAPAPTFSSYHAEELESEEIAIRQIQQGPFELTVFGDNYLIFERMLGDDLKPNNTASYIFIILLGIATIMLLSIITLFSRFWYLVGMGLFILFVASFRLEVVMLFGTSNKLFTIITLSIFLPVSFYFQFLRTTAGFGLRLFTFTGVMVVFVSLLMGFSLVAHPALHLAVTGIAAGTALTVLFIFTVAHEILAGFVYVVSQGATQRKSLNHFIIISAIYMANLGLAYAHKIHMIEWNFLFINFFLLVTISGILGIWGFRNREPQYQSIMVADPFGVYFYLSLGTIAFATMGYFIGTANDPILQTIDDAIIYSHLGYGIIFITYVFSNFIGMLAENLPVFKVLYRPNNMPYFTFRFGGLIATLAFVFYNTWQTPVNNAIGGYYNGGGDLYLTLHNTQLSEGFYKRAGVYGFLNHHSNYALANLESRRYHPVEEQTYYENACSRRPTVLSYLNYSDTYERSSRNLQALLILQAAQKHFPGNGPILNTTGLVYSKMNILDSALLYLDAATHTDAKDMAYTNFIAVAAKKKLSLDADSLYRLIHSENPGIRSNALALANFQEAPLDIQIDLTADTVLNLFSATGINNFIFNGIHDVDTAFLNKAIQLGKKRVNSKYGELVLTACAHALYEDGQVGKAFKLLEEVTIASEEPGKHNNTMALWSLEQNSPLVALKFLDYSNQQSYDPAGVTTAIALSEARHIPEAKEAWDAVLGTDDHDAFISAESMTRVLGATTQQIRNSSDGDRYIYCRYRVDPHDTAGFIQIVNLIQDEEVKAKAILERCQLLDEMDDLTSAIALYQHIRGLQISKALYQETVQFELTILAERAQWDLLKQRVAELPQEAQPDINTRMYYDALLAEHAGDSVSATKLYNALAYRNPFDEDAVIAASEWFRQHDANNLKSYNVLVDAVLENPYSVKLLKAYALEAAQNGFDEYTISAIERLREIMDGGSFTAFVTKHSKLLGRFTAS